MQNIEIADAAIARELDANGYIVVPGIDATAVARLCRDIYQDIRFACRDKVNYNTGSDVSGPIRGFAFERLTTTFASSLDRYFHAYDCIVGLMFVKRPSAVAAGEIHLHCDPTLLPDENRQRHLNIWAPLIDVDETNGALWVVPRSHTVFAPVHAFSIPSQFSEIRKTVMEYGRCVPMKAGDMLIFDNRMPHYSQQNLAAADRPAAVLSVVPSGAEFISLFGAADAEFPIEVYRQPRRWYEDTDWTNDSDRPQSGEFLGRLKWAPRSVSREEFIDRVEKRVAPPYHFELLEADGGRARS
jgi:hypothetical protein